MTTLNFKDYECLFLTSLLLMSKLNVLSSQFGGYKLECISLAIYRAQVEMFFVVA